MSLGELLFLLIILAFLVALFRSPGGPDGRY